MHFVHSRRRVESGVHEANLVSEQFVSGFLVVYHVLQHLDFLAQKLLFLRIYAESLCWRG